MRPSRQLGTLAATIAFLTLVGCGDSDDGPAAGGAGRPDGGPSNPAVPRSADRPPPARCPPAAANCAAASGTVLLVEAVDPDGDGDAHLVLASRDAITAPGISVIDIGRELRPDPLPGRGDSVSAAGPVYRGSYGQRQIEATVVKVARRP
jgi:hypothetical protein